jgi:hypothetical protein
MDSWIRPQVTGAPLSTTYQPVDVETDMRGIGRPLSRTPKNTITLAADTQHATGSAVGHGGHHLIGVNPVNVSTSHHPATGLAGSIQSAMSSVIGHMDVPHLRTTHGRLTHPALALKGVGMNRFDPILYHNPAEKAFIPFDTSVNTRIVSKDQWRPPACSLHRLKLMTNRAGSEAPLRPVFTQRTSIPGDNEDCARQRTEAVERYASKIVENEPAPICYPVKQSIATLPKGPSGCYGGAPQSVMTHKYMNTIVTHDPVPSCT